VLLAIVIAPGFGRSQQLFQPVVFSQLFWVLGFYQLVRFVKYLNKKSLWYLTYADNEEELYQHIYVGRNPKQDFDRMKELFKKRIFE
tara:strand:- start:743 stop:1003 length:261 start_codon:yes stop_codon:yes gene_type:complete